MAVGVVLIGLTAVRVPAALRSKGDGRAVPVVSGAACQGAPCRANNDRRPTRGYEVPSVAVDPRDPSHTVVTDLNLVGGRCGWHVTFNGGKDWQDGVFSLPAGFRGCQLDSAGLLPSGTVVMGPTGTVYYVFSSAQVADSPAAHGRAAGPNARGESVLLATSSDGGRTFSEGREILPGGGSDRAFNRPSLTVVAGPAGRDRLLLSVWGCAPRVCKQAYFSRSDDGGASFAAPTLVSPPPGGNSPSPVAVGADGTLYQTFLRRYNDGQAELLVAGSGDEGATFSSRVIDTQRLIGLRYDAAKIAVDPRRGWLYVVFTDERDGDGQSQVFLRRSRDKGRTWEKVVRLHSAPGGKTYSPAMAVAADGRIDVVFYRRLRTNVDDVYWTYSTDGGKTFAPDKLVNDRPIDRSIGYWSEIGDWYPPAIGSSGSAVVIAWSDTRDGTRLTNSQETFVRRVDYRNTK